MLVLRFKPEAVFLVRLKSSWERAHSHLGASFLVLFLYTLCLAGNELAPNLTKNTASSDEFTLSLRSLTFLMNGNVTDLKDTSYFFTIVCLIDLDKLNLLRVVKFVSQFLLLPQPPLK